MEINAKICYYAIIFFSLIQVLAKRLGCNVVMTDAEKGVAVGVGVSVAALGAAAGAVLAAKAIGWLFGGKDSQNSRRK